MQTCMESTILFGVHPSSVSVSVQDLEQWSAAIFRGTIEMAYRAKSGHLGPALSIIDILSVLYFGYLSIDPKRLDDPNRDRFILSKGHGCSSLYVTLAKRGFFPETDLATFTKDNSQFPGHPSSKLLHGIEASTGSLGHGLGIGVGIALAGKRDGLPYRTVVLVSDGECDEGSVWEAVLAAGHWKLGRLTCIVDYNKIQSFGRTADIMDLEPFTDKWRAFRWHVQEVNGHRHAEILEALAVADREPERPSVIIAHTIKGKGISHLENTVESHYWPLNNEQYASVLSSCS